MFTNVYIDNFDGISAPIALNFISKSRNKDNLTSVVKLEEGIYVNKLVGILGGNASGKTSILNAINKVGQLLTSPTIQLNVDEQIENLNQLMSKDLSVENFNAVKDIIENIKFKTSINVQNERRKTENTTIKIEMYIFSDNEQYEGYYTYELIVNGVENKIKLERLSFRKKYKRIPKKIIEVEDAIEGQVYYISKYYNNLIELDQNQEKVLGDKYEYCRTFVKHYIKDSASITTGEGFNYKGLKYIDWYKEPSSSLVTLLRAVDPKIKDVMIDSDSKEQELLFVLNDESKITRNMLSVGTERFLNIMRYVKDIINKNGILIVDEIEQNMHKDLVELVLRSFSEIKNNNSQIIFTTLSPEVFDIVNSEEKKIFKQDTVFIIDSCSDDIKIDKLSEIKIDGERVKGDALVSNLYKKRKISCHPDKEQMNRFIKNIENRNYQL